MSPHVLVWDIETVPDMRGFAAANGHDGKSDEDIRAEIGEVLNGDKPGRTYPEEITLFKSLGLAIEDLFAAEHLYHKAAEQKVGSWIEF